jgi:hypothetical protein
LPFWVVTERERLLHPPSQIPCADPDALIGFTTMARMFAFCRARESGHWQMDLVGDRDGMILLIADAHRRGTSQVCFDCEPDGSGGQLVDVRALIDERSRSDTFSRATTGQDAADFVD